tara:strand:+ start:530 stop:652 length:123 start_codon:yes stop_codon:yes gene_type:complete
MNSEQLDLVDETNIDFLLKSNEALREEIDRLKKLIAALNK